MLPWMCGTGLMCFVVKKTSTEEPLGPVGPASLAD